MFLSKDGIPAIEAKYMVRSDVSTQQKVLHGCLSRYTFIAQDWDQVQN